MTSRERLMSAIRKEQPDRVPVKIWSLLKRMAGAHPSYKRVIEEGIRRTDLVRTWSPGHNWFLSASAPESHVAERPGTSEEWTDVTTVYETPEGPLTRVAMRNALGKPGLQKEGMIKSRQDWRRIMSVPYEPIRPDVSEFRRVDREMGDDGIVMLGAGGHPMYNVQRHIGSELFALWSLEERDFLHEMMDEMLRRQMDYLKSILSQGVKAVFAYVGPELCIPPLQSVRDFHEFVVQYDRRFIDLIHDSGGWVWCHSHGDMGPTLDGFMEMGVDALNPCEPPPAGSLTLAQIRERVGRAVCLEGNIEKHDLYTDTPEGIEEKVREAIRDAAQEGAFILCPTTGLVEWPVLDARTEANWLAYIEAGVKYGKYPFE